MPSILQEIMATSKLPSMSLIDIKSARDYFVKIKIEIFSFMNITLMIAHRVKYLNIKNCSKYISLLCCGVSNIPDHLIIMFVCRVRPSTMFLFPRFDPMNSDESYFIGERIC